MGICPSLDPELRVLQSHNQSLKQVLSAQLKDLRIYNFYTPVSNAIINLPTRYMYNEGILEDIDKLVFYSERQGVTSLQSRSSLFGQNLFEQQIRNSCLIIENEIASQVESKELECERKDQSQEREQGQEQGRVNPNFEGKEYIQVKQVNKIVDRFIGTQSFQNNLSRNESLVAQMNIIYGREINRDEYSQALKLFLKWVQYFNEHSYGGFLKTLYKAFCQSLYCLQKTQFQTLVDQLSIFVQFMVKIYTKIYHLEQLNKSVNGKLFKNQNVYNLIMSFMFRKTKIKSFIRVMVRENNNFKIKKFQEKLKSYGKKNIGHFGIDHKFILIRNQELEKKLKKDNQNTKWSNKNDTQYSKNNKQSSKNPKQSSKNNTQSSKKNIHQEQKQQPESNKQLLQSFQSQLECNSYQKSLRLMSQLSSTNEAISPISKLKTIISIAKSIQQEIIDFYMKDLRMPRAQVPELDPDNLTGIVMYLIVANNNSCLFEELKMIEYFTTTNTLNCISGYYLNLFIAAIEMVLQVNI